MAIRGRLEPPGLSTAHQTPDTTNGRCRTPLLDAISEPHDLRQLDAARLGELASEIRALLVETVCHNGGHLGPNLGVVELTIALHRVFHSPRDRIIFDTGHQAYVHKLLTGRRAGFGTLRERGGLSGYPDRTESPHDVAESSHTSAGLSYAVGLAHATWLGAEPSLEQDPAVVTVVGDGALTGGLAWEALNNLARTPAPVIVVLNDNGRSYAPTVGGLATHLARLRTGRTGTAGNNLFHALGLAYLGPVDGHDVAAVEAALVEARAQRRSAVVHCVTRKGAGYTPAELDQVDQLHSVGVSDPKTGGPIAPGPRTWTDAFGTELLSLGIDDPRVVALSAAMVQPTGLTAFAERFPERTFDVGIAEAHAVTSAAGLALGGMHPVVAVHSTYLNRAFDQVVLDVALHRLPVTFVLDRAGITGPDGPSHHGVWDLAAFSAVPGLRIAAPRDTVRLREELREAMAADGPTLLRFPEATAGEEVPALRRTGGVDVLYDTWASDILVVAVGALAGAAVAAAARLAAVGYPCTVIDPRWIRPVNRVLRRMAGSRRLVVTVEDGVRIGGAGAAIAQELADAGIDTPVRVLGLPDQFIPHGSRDALLAEHGLDSEGIAASIREALPEPTSITTRLGLSRRLRPTALNGSRR